MRKIVELERLSIISPSPSRYLLRTERDGAGDDDGGELSLAAEEEEEEDVGKGATLAPFYLTWWSF